MERKSIILSTALILVCGVDIAVRVAMLCNSHKERNKEPEIPDFSKIDDLFYDSYEEEDDEWDIK